MNTPEYVNERLNTAAALLHDAEGRDVGQALADVRTAEKTLAWVRTELVVVMREAGLSWQAIAAELGITKQGAMKTYSTVVAAILDARARNPHAGKTASWAAARPATPVAGPAVDVPLELAPDERPYFDTMPEPSPEGLSRVTVETLEDGTRVLAYVARPAAWTAKDDDAVLDVLCPVCGSTSLCVTGHQGQHRTATWNSHISRLEAAGVPRA